MADGSRQAAVRRVTVWDPWVRLVHWAIVLLIPFSWWTAETGRFDLHFLSGYAILTLMLFRIAWGLVGSDTARFTRFLKGPAAAIAHFGQMRRDDPHVDIGHNAAGGWMVIVLLLLLLTQATLGLFADDDVLSAGPLARQVSGSTSALATSIHVRLFWVIVAAAVVHILAVVLYRALFGRNLVKAMVTGGLDVPPGQQAVAPRMGNPVLALVLLAASAAFVWWITSLRPDSMF
jgi:cytochrome b